MRPEITAWIRCFRVLDNARISGTGFIHQRWRKRVDPVDHAHREWVVVCDGKLDRNDSIGRSIVGVSVGAFDHQRIVSAQGIVQATIALIVDVLVGDRVSDSYSLTRCRDSVAGSAAASIADGQRDKWPPGSRWRESYCLDTSVSSSSPFDVSKIGLPSSAAISLEVTGALQRSGNTGERQTVAAIPQSFVVAEEKQLVLEDWPAHLLRQTRC